DPKAVKRAVEAIIQAERPVLYLGGGAIAAGADDEGRQLAEKLNLPTTRKLMGVGAVSGRQPLGLRMLGVAGGFPREFARQQLRPADFNRRPVRRPRDRQAERFCGGREIRSR